MASWLFVKMTDILQATLNCDLKKLKLFLSDKRKVNREIPGTEGCTPLHLIVGVDNVNGRDEVLSYLLEIGGDPNARSHDDLTPVHIAAMWNNCSELEKLLQSGGNPWMTDNENKNAFDLSIDNHAYEAYQLLNKYLAEDKLNFRVNMPRNNRTQRSFKQDSLLNRAIVNGDNVYSKYFSAHENFPVYFSSDEESSESFLNVSKILKKDLTRSHFSDRSAYFTPQHPGRKMTSSNLTKSRFSECSAYITPQQAERKITSNNLTKSQISEHNTYYCTPNTYSTPQHPERKIVWNKDIDLLSDIYSIKGSTDCSESAKEEVCVTQPPSSSETEAYTASEKECTVPDEKNSETIIEYDDEIGVVLVEKSLSVVDFPSFKSCKLSDCDNYSAGDWKSSHSQSISSVLEESCISHVSSVFIPPDYQKLSNASIYFQLKSLGDNPGPVSDSTREIYLRRLTKLKSGCNTSCILPKPKYCNEVYMFLEGKFDADRIQNMMNAMSGDFESENPNQKWREGNQRCSFNYFLLDPRVTQNLPMRLKHLSFEKAFLTFLDALFYVGKGMRARPYSHLLEAAKVAKDAQWKSDKVAHILDIWGSGHGVISLHCFNNCIPVEAYTQEACIIDAVGLENLTNIKNGNYYGVAAKWKWSWKRKVGVELLHRALQIFILEGEKQIMPKDVRSTKL